MSAAPPPDPWTALQRPGVPSVPGLVAGSRLAYATTGVFGDGVLGYDCRLQLPDHCFNCGAAAGSRRLALVYRRFVVRVPQCAACGELRAAARVLTVQAAVATAALLAVVVGALRLPAWAGLAVVGMLLLLYAMLVVKTVRARRRSGVVVQAVSDDGVVRVRGVHPAAIEAIVALAEASHPPR